MILPSVYHGYGLRYKWHFFRFLSFIIHTWFHDYTDISNFNINLHRIYNFLWKLVDLWPLFDLRRLKDRKFYQHFDQDLRALLTMTNEGEDTHPFVWRVKISVLLYNIRSTFLLTLTNAWHTNKYIERAQPLHTPLSMSDG